jgi:hypothetical protein
MVTSLSARPEPAACAISPAAYAGMRRRSRHAQRARMASRCRTRVHAGACQRIGREPSGRCSCPSHSPIPQSMTRQVFASASHGGRPPCQGWSGRKSLDPRKANPQFMDLRVAHPPSTLRTICSAHGRGVAKWSDRFVRHLGAEGGSRRSAPVPAESRRSDDDVSPGCPST